MRWMKSIGHLLARGLVGINSRNSEFILRHNPRTLFPIVDDKLLMMELCARIDAPTPPLIGVISSHADLRDLNDYLDMHAEHLVIKPARGAGGRGIIVLVGRRGNDLIKSNGRLIDHDGVRQHVADVLAGVFSLGYQADKAILQRRVACHPVFAPVSPRGIPDIRLLLYRFEIAMAMLRLPTIKSGGRSNLHQGGIGVGLEIETGRTHHAVHGAEALQRHPDTGESIIDLVVPDWPQVIDLARKVARAVGLGFVGIDIVIDPQTGPMLLESNARPGLAIQLANNQGLHQRIAEMNRQLFGDDE